MRAFVFGFFLAGWDDRFNQTGGNEAGQAHDSASSGPTHPTAAPPMGANPSREGDAPEGPSEDDNAHTWWVTGLSPLSTDNGKDANYFATCSYDKTVRIFDKGGKCKLVRGARNRTWTFVLRPRKILAADARVPRPARVSCASCCC